MAHTRCMLEKQGYMHTPTRLGAHTHARKHRPKYNTYCFSLQQWFCERASMLRYTYIACLVVHITSETRQENIKELTDTSWI